jgi:hypothetical protein
MLATRRTNGRTVSRATFRTAAGLLSVALIGAACGGAAAPTPTPGSSPGTSQPPGGQATPAGGGTPTTAPVVTPAGGAGGATLPDGSWTAGTVHAVISGPVSQTIDAPLLAANSVSGQAQTSLIYVAEDTATQVSIAIYPDDVAISVTTATFVGGGGSTADAPCDASITRADANAVEGRVICTNAPVIDMSGASQLVNIDATFSATR